jgi:4-hydroxyphenylacetate 3-monooxygenase
MIRTGEEYRAGLRDGREVWIDGERVGDVTKHPAFEPVVDLKARMYDMAQEGPSIDVMSYCEGSERHSTLLRPPTEKAHWHEKWRAVDAYLNEIRGVLTRVGDETVGEMWSLLDGRDVLNEIDPRFGDNIDRHIRRVLQQDLFHVSANTDPKGDRSKRPQDQDPDMMVHVVKETDAGIVLRGAKYETAASYADQAFLKPTIASWTDEQLSDYAVAASSRWVRRASNISAAPALPGAPAPPTTRSPTASTRSIRW